mgnify:CR=1 FL=1
MIRDLICNSFLFCRVSLTNNSRNPFLGAYCVLIALFNELISLKFAARVVAFCAQQAFATLKSQHKHLLMSDHYQDDDATRLRELEYHYRLSLAGTRSSSVKAAQTALAKATRAGRAVTVSELDSVSSLVSELEDNDAIAAVTTGKLISLAVAEQSSAIAFVAVFLDLLSALRLYIKTCPVFQAKTLLSSHAEAVPSVSTNVSFEQQHNANVNATYQSILETLNAVYLALSQCLIVPVMSLVETTFGVLLGLTASDNDLLSRLSSSVVLRITQAITSRSASLVSVFASDPANASVVCAPTEPVWQVASLCALALCTAPLSRPWLVSDFAAAVSACVNYSETRSSSATGQTSSAGHSDDEVDGCVVTRLLAITVPTAHSATPSANVNAPVTAAKQDLHLTETALNEKDNLVHDPAHYSHLVEQCLLRKLKEAVSVYHVRPHPEAAVTTRANSSKGKTQERSASDVNYSYK